MITGSGVVNVKCCFHFSVCRPGDYIVSSSCAVFISVFVDLETILLAAVLFSFI